MGCIMVMASKVTAPNTDHYFPVLIESNQVGQISAGYYHSLFAKFRNPAGPGSFLGMGDNINGELGDVTIFETNQPDQLLFVAHSTAVSAISAGEDFSLFTEPDNSLWAMGWNSTGQLGDGTTNDSPVREMILSSNVTAIATGFQHSLYLSVRRQPLGAWAPISSASWAMARPMTSMAANRSCPATSRRLPPGAITACSSCPTEASGRWVTTVTASWATARPITAFFPLKIVPTGVTAISAGEYHSLFTMSEGSLFGMGHNAEGELGDGTYIDRHSRVLIVAGVAPLITSFNFSGTTLTLNATNGFAGRTYVTLVNTNLAKPLNQWPPIATNVLSADGAFTVTATNGVDPNGAQQFYLIELQ